ncbi:MAG TPA: tyrosine-type recombinase/integrase [Streptosporangiaceae bacterium]
MAYVIERESRSGARYVGIYKAADGKYKSAGTYGTHERAFEVAQEEERHARGFLTETSPADKATMTIAEFCEKRFLPHHAVGPGTRQNYGYIVKNHIVPYIGHLRISEVNRETFFNLLVQVLPAEEATQVTVTATRRVLSAMCQMAFDEGYRGNNPIRTIRLPQAPSKLILVTNHDQWRRFEEALIYPPAKLYARLNVTTWARTCEMIGFRPRDFDFGEQMLNVTRSTVYVTAKYNPSGNAGWVTKPNPKNGDWRRFTISKQMCQLVQEHIEEYGLGPEDLLFPQWMFAYLRPKADDDNDEQLPPLVSKTGIVYEHGTKGARYTMNCHCKKCKDYAAAYQRQWRREQSAKRARAGEHVKTFIWRQDGSEFLAADVWGRFWNTAREAAGLPAGFTPYNARHTGISWAIAKGVDLQKIRQRAGHSSLEVTSRYAAILDEHDTSLADALEEIFVS